MTHKTQFTNQTGFTLIEILAAVTVIAILGAVGWHYFSTDRTRATALISKANDITKGLVEFKQDISCYPQTLSALYNQADSENTRCGIDGRTSWRQPYVSKESFNANGDLMLDDLVNGSTMSLITQAGGPGQQWILRISNIPTNVITQLTAICNGSSNHAGRCTANTEGGQLGNIDVVFDETT